MSAIGKIFVFLVLILSLLQGALTLVLYTARTTWAAQNKELQTQLTASRANAKQWEVEKGKAETEANARVAKVEDEKKKLQEESKAQKDQIADLQANEQKWKVEEKAALKATVAAAQADVTRRQADVDQLKSTLTVQMEENKKLVDLNNTLRQEKTTAEIEANALRARDKELVEKLQDLAREIARAKSPLAGGVGTKMGTGKNPPPEKIEGLVRQADPSGLVKITIGSDAGLMKGHTLEVFRLSNIPEQSKYLGTIKIIDVSATEAVGQPLGRMAAPLQVGDTVASRILGAN
jgi:hypothetical protein